MLKIKGMCYAENNVSIYRKVPFSFHLNKTNGANKKDSGASYSTIDKASKSRPQPSIGWLGNCRSRTLWLSWLMKLNSTTPLPPINMKSLSYNQHTTPVTLLPQLPPHPGLCSTTRQPTLPQPLTVLDTVYTPPNSSHLLHFPHSPLQPPFKTLPSLCLLPSPLLSECTKPITSVPGKATLPAGPPATFSTTGLLHHPIPLAPIGLHPLPCPPAPSPLPHPFPA